MSTLEQIVILKLHWILGYLVFVLPLAFIFSLICIKAFKVNQNRHRWTLGSALLVLFTLIFVVYYNSTMSELGTVRRASVAGKHLFVEGLEYKTDFRDQPNRTQRLRKDPVETAHQMLFVIDAESGLVLARLEDYQLASYNSSWGLLYPTRFDLPYAIIDIASQSFVRFFTLSELRKELPLGDHKLADLELEFQPITSFRPTPGGSKSMFKARMTDGSLMYFNALTGEVVTSAESAPLRSLERSENFADQLVLINGVSSVELTMTKPSLDDTVLELNGNRNGLRLWSRTLNSIHASLADDYLQIDDRSFPFAAMDDRFFFFTDEHAVALKADTGELLWLTSI